MKRLLQIIAVFLALVAAAQVVHAAYTGQITTGVQSKEPGV